MKKIAPIFYMALLVAGVASCNQSPDCCERPPMNPKSYIQGFFELNDIYISPMRGFKVNKENNSINLMDRGGFDAPKVHDISEGVGIYIVIGSGVIEKGLISWHQGGTYTYYYNELVAKIGDISYNSELMYGLRDRIISVADTLRAANITCDKQFDESHPAGSSLNDIFSVYFEDPYAVIKNGYKSLTDDSHYSLEGIPEKFPYSLFGARLSSVDLSKKLYMGVEWGCVLETAPENTGEYTFTVSITNQQGKKIEKTAAPIKLKGLK